MYVYPKVSNLSLKGKVLLKSLHEVKLQSLLLADLLLAMGSFIFTTYMGVVSVISPNSHPESKRVL